MKAGGGGEPTGGLLKQIEKSFQSFDEFRKAFVTAAVAQFGSGWVWLVQEGDVLKIVKTLNADTPVAHGQTALLACDVWNTLTILTTRTAARTSWKPSWSIWRIGNSRYRS